MDAQQFLADFGHIANAPSGIARLRELVLQLAISGRLVESSASNLTVAKEISDSCQLRTAYEERLEIRKSQPHPPLDDQPFAIPSDWQWARLEQLALYIQRGKGPKYADTGSTYVVSQKCVRWAGFDLRQARHIAEDSLSSYGEERFLCNGDLLWNSTGTGTAGRVAIYSVANGERVVADSHVTVIRLAKFLPRYLWCVIASPWTQARIGPTHPDSLVSGTTQQVELATSTARALAIPCPPFEEQSRIVAKVDELMALCDKLEAKQQDCRKLQNALRQSTLQAVAAATSPHELQTTWTRLANNFGRLFQTPEDVMALRDVIFDLAMRGMLLQTAKLNAVAAGEDMPSLPRGWAWTTLGELSEYITSGSRGWKGYISTSGDAFIRSQDIKRDALIFENPAFVSLPEKAEGKRTLVREGDLLLTITGGNVGKCAFVPALSGNAYVSQHVALIRLHDSGLSEFIHFWMINTHGGRSFLSRYIYGDKPGLNLTQVASVPVPVPPENDRVLILESLRRYQVMCDRLAKQVDSERKLAEVLAGTAVSSLTGINVAQEEDEALKAPQTELIAPLQLGTPPDAKAQAPLATILARHHGELPAEDLWQRFGGEIDAFYAQLKTEVAHGWIVEPQVAEMREKHADKEIA